MIRLGAFFVGLGLWLAQRQRQPLHQVQDFAAIGRAAITRLNDAWQTAETARRHAKPSSRKRVG